MRLIKIGLVLATIVAAATGQCSQDKVKCDTNECCSGECNKWGLCRPCGKIGQRCCNKLDTLCTEEGSICGEDPNYSSPRCIQDTNGGSTEWGSCSNIPNNIAEASAGIYGNKIYFIGGAGKKLPQESSYTYEYDIGTDKWNVMTNKVRPCVSDHHSGLSDGNNWWLFGGLGDCKNVIQRFNMKTKRWIRVGTIPDDLAAGSVNVFKVENKKYLVCGGFTGGCSTTSNEKCGVYNFKTDTWDYTADLLYNYNHAAYGEIDGKFVIAGGRVRGNCGSAGYKDVQILNKNSLDISKPFQSQWTKGPALPYERNSFGNGATCGGRLWAVGGENKQYPEGVNESKFEEIGYIKEKLVWNRVDAYNPSSNKWEEGPFMKTARHGHFCVCAQVQKNGNTIDRLYCIGGGEVEGISFTNKCEYLDMDFLN